MVLLHLTIFNYTVIRKGIFLLNQERLKVCLNGVQLAPQREICFHYKILHLKTPWQ